jgi:hypothetical protein
VYFCPIISLLPNSKRRRRRRRRRREKRRRPTIKKRYSDELYI